MVFKKNELGDFRALVFCLPSWYRHTQCSLPQVVSIINIPVSASPLFPGTWREKAMPLKVDLLT